MKTFIKLITAVIILAQFTACQDEMIPEASDVGLEKETGLDLPEVYMDKDQLDKFRLYGPKHREIEHSVPSEKPVYVSLKEAQPVTRARGVEGISFGYSIHSSTVNQGNSISRNFGHPGEDRVYKLEINTNADIKITLSQMNTDLDLYLSEIYEDAYGRELVGNLLAKSERGGTNDEEITIKVNAGEYFIIVDSYTNSGRFTLTAQDITPPPPPRFCEDYENLTATHHPGYGISRQTNTWSLWEPNAGDGRVLYEDGFTDNKVVKMDWGRFYYQDVVRTLIGLPITHGLYTMDFKMYVPYGYSSGFRSEKLVETGRNHSESGFKITIDEYGRLTFIQNGITKHSNYRVSQDRWIDINLVFDMTYNTIYAVIDHSVIVYFSASAPRFRYGGYMKSIAGMNFFANESGMKYHIDDVCVTEIEPGYENPIINTLSVGYEEIISFQDDVQSVRLVE